MRSKILAAIASAVVASVSLLAVPAAAAPAPVAAAAQVAKSNEPIRKPVVTTANPQGKQLVGKAALASCGGSPSVCYNYARGVRTITTTTGTGSTQIAALVSQHKPFINVSTCGGAATGTTYHSLWEMSAEDVYNPGGRNIVEIGWTVDVALNGDCNPHLFCYAWANNTGLGYNAAAIIDNASEAVDCGTSLAYTASGSAPSLFYQYRIERSTQCSGGGNSGTGGGWRLAWKAGGTDHIIGCYPDTIWTSRGTSMPAIQSMQSFTEIASKGTTDCADMGSGVFGTSTLPSAALDQQAMSIAGYTNTFDSVQVSGDANAGAGDSPTAWRAFSGTGYSPSDPDRMRLGGPGRNSALTGTGSIGSC